MFKHILVPADMTEESLRALTVAAEMATYGTSRVTVLHVIEILDDVGYEEHKDFYENLKKRSQKKMDQIADPPEADKVLIDKRIRFGKRVGEILRFADENEVDLIVLVSHRIDRDNPTQGWGTISHQISILAHCPVMMVK